MRPNFIRCLLGGHRSAIWACVLSACAAQAGDLAELQDAAARMQYAYYTRDLRALQSAVEDLQRVAVPEDRNPLRDYQVGVGYWRLADLHGASGTARSQALGRCEDHLERAVRAQPRFAEALAVRNLCTFQRNDLVAVGARALKRDCARQNALQKALELAPRNPRVLYVAALCADKDGDAKQAMQTARSALTAFQQEQLGASDEAGWGQADTSLLLARLHLQQGDRTAARDSVEQALILAPDYVAARELQSEIAAAR